MDFCSIDVETANPDLASICQIGIAGYASGKCIFEWESLVNPDDYFDYFNVGVHGITEDMVKDAPTIPDIYEALKKYLQGQIVVCHTHFDRSSLRQAIEARGLPEIECTWLDSARIVRRTWDHFRREGYGLKNVCDYLEYSFNHHNALEDAKASAFILNNACAISGLTVKDWVKKSQQRISSNKDYYQFISQDGNTDGHLYGEVVVFTGSLSCERKVAASKAAICGCRVMPGVTRKTTILVVGTQDMKKLVGHEKSKRHREAEAKILIGQEIKIIDELAFWKMLEMEPLYEG